MDEVFRILNELCSTNSQKEKVQIIRENSANPLFTDTLNWLLNPFIISGIDVKKINKNCGKPSVHINSWLEMINYLIKHNTGTNQDIAAVQYFINQQKPQDCEVYQKLITKTLRLGCDAKIVNKAMFDGFIPVFNVQLGVPISKVKLNGTEKIFISQKLNGCRCLYMNGEFYSRTGKKYKGLDHILNDIKLLNLDDDIVLDGELIRKNSDGISDSENFQIGTGVANSKTADKSELEYVIFDVITTSDFESGISELKYGERKIKLLSLSRRIAELKQITNLRIVPMWYEGCEHDMIAKCLAYAENNDYEGCIINLDEPYMCKRTKSLIKVKCFYDCDLKCNGIEEGSGKYQGTLGAIVCDYKGNELRVGSGFSDEQRDFYWRHPNEIIDKIVTVKYKEETKSKNGGKSLQFPVFQTVRFDKQTESYN